MVFYCYEKVWEIIRENCVLMDRLVDLLIEKEIIEGDEFCRIVLEYVELLEK